MIEIFEILKLYRVLALSKILDRQRRYLNDRIMNF